MISRTTALLARRWVPTGILVASVACTSALREPAPIAELAARRSSGRGAAELINAANESWAKRDQAGQSARAESDYLDAAEVDPAHIDALIGAMKAISFRIERERGVDRARLAETEVQLGQWCLRRAPSAAECDYRLAIALGQQARERPSTGHDALGKIVELLHRAIAADPSLDSAGPDRVLSIVLVRAPGWPAGPGDVDAGLLHAVAAVARYPDVASNQLALATALEATGAADRARESYARAFALLSAAQARGDPDATSLLADARNGLAHASRP